MFTRHLFIATEQFKSFFLFGPRGTGKTSWVKAHFPEALYIDLLDSETYFALQSRPGRFRQWVLESDKQWVVIDEVQRLPILLDEVHRLIEGKKHAFILTGSSSRSLKRAGVNLLAGRALSFRMHPLIASEAGDEFDMRRALQYGMLPAIFSEGDPKRFLQSYTNTYLREEVMQEGLTRNIGAFSRFLEVASFSQGGQVNMSAIAREVGVSQKMISSYFDILLDLLLACRIPIFSKRAKRQLSRHDKFYYFDVGVYQTLRPKGILDSPSEITGAALETLFLQHVQAVIDYKNLALKVYFWRTKAGMEVDFILYGEHGLYAFEIKSASYVDNKMLRGLSAFKKDYPIAKCFLIYQGQYAEQHRGISVIPMHQILRQLEEVLQ